MKEAETLDSIPENKEEVCVTHEEEAHELKSSAAHHLNDADAALEFGPSGEAPLSLPEEFTKALSEESSNQRKLEVTLQFMQQSLEKGGGRHFKEFWNARKLCIAFFKEEINATARVHLWGTYSELCREARRLKELFDEQNAFLLEQMDKAIKSVQDEINSLDEIVKTLKDIPEIDQVYILKEHREQYNSIQKTLTVLNACAQRTTALRKELIHADIKLRSKNKLFHQLSSVGDLIFPRRKQLIHEISDLYLSDVQRFLETVSIQDLDLVGLFDVREQIKLLQQIAKLLTLTTEVFTTSRLELSDIWDKVKTLVKEKKRAQADIRHEKRSHKELLLAKLQEIKDGFNQKTLDSAALEKALYDFHRELRSLSLLPPDVRHVKEELKEFEQVVSSHIMGEKNEREQRLREKESEKKLQLNDFKSRIQQLVDSPDSASEESVSEIERQIGELSLSKKEKYDFEFLLAHLRNKMALSEKEKILSSHDENSNKLQKKEILLQQKHELKERLDSLRKEQGASGADFSYAMQLNDLIREEKERLLAIEESLQELEKS